MEENKRYNLTNAQKNIYMIEMAIGKSAINNIAGKLHIKNNFDEEICEQVINDLIRKNDNFRININKNKKTDEISQCLEQYEYIDVQFQDFTNYSSDELKEVNMEFFSKPFDIFNSKLYEFRIEKYSKNTGAIILKIHHLIADAWTFKNMIDSLYTSYEMKLGNTDMKSVKPVSYIEHLEEEMTSKEYQKQEKDKEFYREYLSNPSTPTSLSTITNNEKLKQAKRYTVTLRKEYNDELIKYTKNNKVSILSLFMAAFSTYIYRITNSTDIVLGTPILGRKNFKEKNMMGMFVSTLPIRAKLDENMSFSDLIKNITKDTLKIFKHQSYALTNILNDVHTNTNLTGNLFNTLISYQNARTSLDVTSYNAEWIFLEQILNDLEIHITDIENTGVLNISYDYSISKFTEREIRYLNTRIETIIYNFLKVENVTVGNIDIISQEEKNSILKNFNDTKTQYDIDLMINQIFEKIALTNKNKVAIICKDKSLTYDELNRKANKFAYYLYNAKNLKQGDYVCILLNRVIDLSVVLVACSKLDIVYVPVDVNYPDHRKEYIINNSNSKLVINQDILDEYEIYSRTNFMIEEVKLDNRNVEDTIYSIYTSGSTGNPKGVKISNKNLINFINGSNKILKINKNNIVVSVSTISFDIFGLEFWLALLVGSTVVIADELEQIDSNRLNILCKKNSVDVIQTTPSKFKLLMMNEKNNEYIRNMKKILLCGENLPLDLINKIKLLTKSSIYNGYGPTETTIYSTIANITTLDYITIGKPIANTYIKIVDEKGRLLPLGYAGEMLIGGDSVSSGYLNNSSLTNEKFVFDNDMQCIMYKTGDLAKLDYDNNLYVHGRIDFQVKINGQRIELEEIEKQVRNVNLEILEAIAVVKNSNIYVYYIPKNTQAIIDIEQIRNKINNILPQYMCPIEYFLLEDVPYTPTGKIDRKAINKLEIKYISKRDIKQPTNELERIIYNIWKNNLSTQNFGITDDFFRLGGDSLDAINVRIELLSKNIDVDYDDLFKYKTIEKLASSIVQKDNLEEFKLPDTKLDFEPILSNNKILLQSYKEAKIDGVFLTGAAGFLGAHILAKLIDENKVSKIYCLVRSRIGLNKNVDSRLKETLNYYFGDKYDEEFGKKIIAVEGDIAIEPSFGISIDKLNEIALNVDAVINSAALVKHYGNVKLFEDVNYLGTKNVIEFCKKYNKKMIQISTLSVSGNGFDSVNIKENNLVKQTTFDETSFYNNQSINNVYVYTKFKAEELVLKEIKENKLQANIIRMGNLTNRVSDLKFQSNIEENAFANRIKSVLTIGFLPKSLEKLYLEFTPVDYSADFVVKVLKYFNMNNTIFHAFDNNHVNISDLIDILKDMGISLNIIPDESFKLVIDKLLEEKDTEKLKGIINDLDENSVLNYTTTIKIDSNFTTNYMNKLGFKWPEISKEYVIKYIEYLIRIGFLKIDRKENKE